MEKILSKLEKTGKLKGYKQVFFILIRKIYAYSLTNWIISNLGIPNINPYQVLRTVRYLIVQLDKDNLE